MLKRFYILIIVILALISIASLAFAELDTEYEVNISKGVSKLNSKDYNDAIEIFNATLKSYPEDSKTMLMLGISLSRKGSLTESEEVLKKVLGKQYEIARTNYELGIVKYKQGDYFSAKDYFSQAERFSEDASLNTSIKSFMAAMEGVVKRKRYNLFTTVGLQYDTNVVLKSDVGSKVWRDNSDVRTIFYLKGDYAIVESPVRVVAGYSFYQSLHKRLSGFNVQNHELELRAEYSPVNILMLEGKYLFDYTYMGSDAYSRIHTITPSAKLMLINNMPTKFVYSYSKRGFFDTNKADNNNSRSGNMNSYGIEQKVSVFEGLFFNLGYYYERNSAEESQYSFKANKYMCSLNYDYARKWTFRAKFDYYDRNFMGKTEVPLQPYGSEKRTRDDITRTYSFTFTKPITSLLSVSLDQTFIRNSSSIFFDDYKRSITGIFLTARF